jgi:hypothetical protein
MGGAWRSRQERAIIYGSMMGDATLSDVDALLVEAGFRAFSPRSYEMVKQHYLPVFRMYPPSLLENIRSPRTLAQLREAYWRRDAEGAWRFVPPQSADDQEVPE